MFHSRRLAVVAVIVCAGMAGFSQGLEAQVAVRLEKPPARIWFVGFRAL